MVSDEIAAGTDGRSLQERSNLQSEYTAPGVEHNLFNAKCIV